MRRHDGGMNFVKTGSKDGTGKQGMNTYSRPLKREEILTLASQAKLLIVDGDACYLNDRASDKELVALVRLIESALAGASSSSPVRPLRFSAVC